MDFKTNLEVILSLSLTLCAVSGEELRQFPKNLKFGVSSAAYQTEGAWNKDGKTESIWDRAVHSNPCLSSDCTNGDIACDSYNNIERDVEMISNLGVDHYKFSISWTRILPTGFGNKINEAGVVHYKNLIDLLLEHNIEPIVNMYHWDLPRILHELGGWTNPLIADWFGDYSRILFKLFGDKVKKWITINEPFQICFYGYESGVMAPALKLPGIGVYMCSKYTLLAHARAWHIYDREFRDVQKGQIGIVVEAEHFVPLSQNDTEAAQLFNYLFWDMYAYPIFSEQGDFPAMVKKQIANKSFSQGFLQSRLPEFSPEEITYVKGTSDFLGLNHYSTYYAYSSVIGLESGPSWIDDVSANLYQPVEWSNFDGESVKIVPWGFYEVLKRIREDYNNPPILITENGYAYDHKGLNDELRIKYHHEYLNAMLDAIDEGSNITAYCIWSLMDSFEWNMGYTKKYGLYEVDFGTPERTRTPRVSVEFYKNILRTRTLSQNLTLSDILKLQQESIEPSIQQVK